MPFLPPIQQRQSTEDKSVVNKIYQKLIPRLGIKTGPCTKANSAWPSSVGRRLCTVNIHTQLWCLTERLLLIFWRFALPFTAVIHFMPQVLSCALFLLSICLSVPCLSLNNSAFQGYGYYRMLTGNHTLEVERGHGKWAKLQWSHCRRTFTLFGWFCVR